MSDAVVERDAGDRNGIEAMPPGPLTVVAVGDLRPDGDSPGTLFALSAHVLRDADVAFGQLETTFSRRGTAHVGVRSPRRTDPANASALRDAGFDVISVAGNHALDFGYQALFDTISTLSRHGIAPVGVGRNLEEARAPVVVDRRGTRIAFLAYNSILMGSLRGYAATADRPGCNPMRAHTTYEPIGFDFQPGTPARAVTFAYPQDVERMVDDIETARGVSDVIVVSQHAGVLHVHAEIATYQKEIAHAAIDAGAQAVLQHHAHVLRGIESYRGRPIFYGLGNFALPSVGHRREAEWWSKVEEHYGLQSEPGWERYPGPPESRKTIIAKLYVEDGQLARAAYLPCRINRAAQAEVLSRQDPRAAEVFDYVEDLSRSQGLRPIFAWDGDEVVVS